MKPKNPSPWAYFKIEDLGGNLSYYVFPPTALITLETSWLNYTKHNFDWVTSPSSLYQISLSIEDRSNDTKSNLPPIKCHSWAGIFFAITTAPQRISCMYRTPQLYQAVNTLCLSSRFAYLEREKTESTEYYDAFNILVGSFDRYQAPFVTLA